VSECWEFEEDRLCDRDRPALVEQAAPDQVLDRPLIGFRDGEALGYLAGFAHGGEPPRLLARLRLGR